MKATLTFNLDEADEREAHIRAIKSTNAYLAIMAIRDEIFRPARKHGYSDTELRSRVDKHEDIVLPVISLLESEFFNILDNYDINLESDIS